MFLSITTSYPVLFHADALVLFAAEYCFDFFTKNGIERKLTRRINFLINRKSTLSNFNSKSLRMCVISGA